MPKKNKASKNGFWKFAMDLKNDPEYKTLNNQQLQDLAGQFWAKMSLDDRKKFAESSRQDIKISTIHYDSKEKKYTSDGIPIDTVQRLEQEQEFKVSAMKEYIDGYIKNAKNSGNLLNEVFLIIHVNHLIYHQSTDKYYICEISIAPFSLRNGVFIDDIFHEHVHPGDLPLGSYGPAKLHSDLTHRLVELATSHDTPNNCEEVFRKFIKYLRKYSDFDSLPILFAPFKTLSMTEKVIANFCADYVFEEPIKVYDLQYLFTALKNAAFDTPIWKSDTFSYAEIERDIYGFTTDIACSFHEIADITLYCSRSIVIRTGFVICTNCCKDYGILGNPGTHVPGKAKGETTSTWISTSKVDMSTTYSQFFGSSSKFNSSDITYTDE